MRALTVRQPWAWAIVHGGKDIENRVQALGPYRGPVAIHAGAGFSDEGGQSPLVLGHEGYADAALPKSAVIGVVDLVDVHHADDVVGILTCRCSPWAMAGHHHMVLANPRPLSTPIPAKGRLGLWRPGDELTAAIREQVTC